MLIIKSYIQTTNGLKDKHKLEKMLLSILDSELNDDFYLKKLRLNPSNKVTLVGFKWVFGKWTQSGTPEDNVAKVILLDIHYKYDKVENMASLLDVIDKESCVAFFMDDTTRTIVVIYTTHSMKDAPIVWKGLDWESFFLVHLNVRAMFKIIACICDHKSFESLLTTMCKSTFVRKNRFEFVQYMERPTKVPGSLMILNVPMLMFVNLLSCKIGTNVCVEIL